MTENIKLILVDLDLTLLHSDATLSEHTVSVLKECRKMGIMTGFCTSRGLSRVIQYKDKINPEIIIANAGACIYYKDKLVHSETFTLEESKSLLEMTYRTCGDNAEITVDTADDFFWNKKHDKSTSYMPESKYDDFKNFSLPIMKFCVATTDTDAVDKIKSVSENCDAILFSDIPWYKFAPKSATKENGIRFLSEYLSIDVKQMIAFGDDYSDIGMLKLCGKGIAMKNAIEPVKQIADEITASCDEDGVAVYLEKAILSKQSIHQIR